MGPFLRYGWLLLLVILWFPFDWLSQVWPAFGIPFRAVFHNARNHFIGHTVFFLVIGILILAILPTARRLHWYGLGLVIAALVQESIQAAFRYEIPTFTDFNAFMGDALGGLSAWLVWHIIRLRYDSSLCNSLGVTRPRKPDHGVLCRHEGSLRSIHPATGAAPSHPGSPGQARR
jgi:hypothetical protein